MATASDRERELHAQILEKNDLAFAKLCDAYYESVFKKVRLFNKDLQGADDTLVADVVTDAFIHYFEKPDRYDAEKQGLEYFLAMDAEGDLRNALQKLHRKHKKNPKPVELDEKSGNRLIDKDHLDPFEKLVNKETSAFLEQKLEGIFETETDVLVAQLLLSGERRSSEYAKALNIEHLMEEEQRLEIKKQKDRIDKVIRRKLRSTRDG